MRQSEIYPEISLFFKIIIKLCEIGDEIFAIHYESFHQQLMVIYSGILWVAFKIVHRHIALELKKSAKKIIFVANKVILWAKEKKS